MHITLFFCFIAYLITLFCLAHLEYGNRNNAVKVEPRDHAASPYYHGYRDQMVAATPSPQPVSPQTFMPLSPAPTHYNNVPNILQHTLQTPRFTPNNFDQLPTLDNPYYTPSVLAPTATPVNGNSSIWNNTSIPNGNNDLYVDRATMGNLPGQSQIFQQTHLPTTAQQTNLPDAPRGMNSNSLMDLDSNNLLQMIDNISGEIRQLSFMSDMPMDSMSKTQNHN